MNGALPAWLFLPVQLRLTCLNKDGYEFKVNNGFMTTEEAEKYVETCGHNVTNKEIWHND